MNPLETIDCALAAALPEGLTAGALVVPAVEELEDEEEVEPPVVPVVVVPSSVFVGALVPVGTVPVGDWEVCCPLVCSPVCAACCPAELMVLPTLLIFCPASGLKMLTIDPTIPVSEPIDDRIGARDDNQEHPVKPADIRTTKTMKSPSLQNRLKVRMPIISASYLSSTRRSR